MDTFRVRPVIKRSTVVAELVLMGIPTFETRRALKLNELINKIYLNYRSIFAARQLIITYMNKPAFGELNDRCSSANL